ncbi:DUF1801 domain-containing protein [Actibacterium pelagium]|uniref:YdhG-like domain-containing protein n=1 Tax=Actibacterium pelagium TaxID=2029103 RepID=A0A917AFR8_9RHOB|nr:DUF1801 domain-containing protein [Actibacterium pelagium]GGE48128.1 hypothetical protein GCM10011517_14890 [Actibacterium pelagium]
MSENKTKPSETPAAELIAAVEHPMRRADGQTLLEMFQRATGYAPVVWAPAIIGFGRYHYRYKSGREGDFLATGFAVRKRNLVVYIMPGYADYGAILDRLGKYKKSKSCLYINKLADIDLTVLEELILAGLRDLNKIWPVQPA